MKYQKRRKNTRLRRITEGVLALLYPVKCPFCGKLTGKIRVECCTECRKKLPFVSQPRCFRCGKPVDTAETEYCMDCVKKKHFFTRGISLWSYDQSVKQAVYRFKYKNQRCYAAYFGRELIRRYYPVMKAWNAQAILPVPIHKKRYRQRGYNQAELIAKELAEYLQIPVDNGRIRRVKNTRPQKELNDMQRHKNLKNAFHMVKNSVELKRVIIVDDIYTTGATVDAMAELLQCAGAEEIYVVTLCIGKGY